MRELHLLHSSFDSLNQQMCPVCCPFIEVANLKRGGRQDISLVTLQPTLRHQIKPLYTTAQNLKVCHFKGKKNNCHSQLLSCVNL